MTLQRPASIRAKLLLEIVSGLGTLAVVYGFGFSPPGPVTFAVVCTGMVLAGVWRGFGHVQLVVSRKTLIHSAIFIVVAAGAIWMLESLARTDAFSEVAVAVLISIPASCAAAAAACFLAARMSQGVEPRRGAVE